jgi:hypothetical protein
MQSHPSLSRTVVGIAGCALLLSATFTVAVAAQRADSTSRTPVFNIQLCAQQEGVTRAAMTKIRRVVANRVHKGFYLGKASIRPSGATCLNVGIPKHISWVLSLARSIASVGQFDLGYTSITKYYPAGTNVRYADEAITNANSNYPVFHVVIAPHGIRGSSLKVRRIKGFYYVALALTSHGSKVFCTFSHRHAKGYAPVVLDRQIISDPPLPSKAICGGSLLVGFANNVSINSDHGPRAMIADIKYGTLPFALHYQIT